MRSPVRLLIYLLFLLAAVIIGGSFLSGAFSLPMFGLGLILVIVGEFLLVPAVQANLGRAIPLLLMGLGTAAVIGVGTLLAITNTEVDFNLGQIFFAGWVYVLVGLLLWLFVPEQAPVVDRKSEFAPAPPDNLTLIKGINTFIQNTLNDAGIKTYAQIAETQPQELFHIVNQEHQQFVGDTMTWVHQAQYLLRGDHASLAQYQERLAVSREVEVDDLTQIEGIGRQANEVLKREGITTFAQLAHMTPKDLYQLITVKHELRVKSDVATWIKQAQYIEKGDWKGLEAYQEKLVDGREVNT